MQDGAPQRGRGGRLGRGLEELETIAERIAHVDAGIAGKRLIVDDRMPSLPQPGDELGEAVDQDARMSLARGTKIRIHAEMDLHVPVLEPRATPLRELGRLHDLGKLEKP